MISIRHFQTAVDRAGSRNVAFKLTSDKSALRTTGTGIIRWVRNLRTSQNRETSRLFISALKQSYGEQVTTQVVERLRLDNRLRAGKPLHSRNVRDALNLAEEIKGQFVRANQNVASGYSRPLASGFDTSLLQVKCDHVAKHLFGKDAATAKTVGARLDLDEIDRTIQEDIRQAGISGKVFVTSEMADGIVDSVLQKKIAATYREVLMEQFDMTRAGSLFHQALSQINPDPETGLAIDPSALDGEVAHEIKKQFAGEIDEIYRNLTRIQARGNGMEDSAEDLTIAVPPERLKEMAAKTVNSCIGERFEAVREALQLPIADPQTKERVVHQVLHSSIPPSLVPALTQAQASISEHFQVLSQYQQPSLQSEVQGALHSGSVYEPAVSATPASGPQMETALHGMRRSVMDAMAGQELSSDNRDRIMQSFWKVLLTGYGYDDAQLKGAALQMSQKESPLRPFAEGVHCLRHLLPQTDAYISDPATYSPMIGVASEYDFMLGNLAIFLQESTGIPIEPAGGVNSMDENFRYQPSDVA